MRSLCRALEPITKSVIVGIVFTCFSLMTLRDLQAQQTVGQGTTSDRLSLDDVSWLFPVPVHEPDLAHFIAIRDLSTVASDDNASEPIFAPDVFNELIGIADGPAGAVAGTSHRISLPQEVRTLDAWLIAGIRIDAGAPGLSSQVIEQYGQAPQIRLILQPVTKSSGGDLKVHDIAVHLIFNFTTPDQLPPPTDGCFPRAKPDIETFKKIVADLVSLRDGLKNGDFGGKQIKTASVPLGVHPGLNDPATNQSLRDALKNFLQRHISNARLGAMAIMGLPQGGAPEPWMFLSLLRLPNGSFIPVKSPLLDGKQFVEALSFSGDANHVIPTPQTNNLNPITCKNEATLPAPTLPNADRKGDATAELFDSRSPSTDRVKVVTDLVANPEKSHFFNTDCISCHSETRRAMDLADMESVPNVDTAVLPRETWNVRNFGWFPSFLRNGHVEATVTRRTANETQAVVEFINRNLLQ